MLVIDVEACSSSFKEFMPFCETYMTAFKNDIEYSQLVLHTTAILQNHKFMQVSTQYALETSVSEILKHLEGACLCF